MTSTDKSSKTLLTKGGEVLVDFSVNKDEDKQIQTLYTLSGKIENAGENVTKLEKEYLGILNAVKGGKRAKMLASQLIPKYLKHFPQKTAPAIDALLDLCEEELIDVRISAIRVLPQICQDSPGNVSEISNVLGQFLLADQQLELDAAKRSFVQLLNIDTKASLGSLFQHIATKDEEGLHKKALEFLHEKVIPSLGTLKPELEEFISKEVQKLISTSDETEFKVLIEILQKLSILNTNEGKKELVQIIADNCGMTDKPKKEDIMKVLNSMSTCIPIFEKTNIQSSSFFNFLVLKALTQVDKFDDKTILKILKTSAELSTHVTTSDARSTLSTIYSILLKYLPAKPKEDESEPLFNFSYAECLLYVFHQLAKKAPGALNPICGIKIITGQPQDSDMKDHSDKLNDFQSRLEYLKIQSKNFSTNIETQIKSIEMKKTDTEEEKKTKTAKKQQLTMATRLIQNIVKMLNVLLTKKPSFIESDSVILSWKKKPTQKTRKASKNENLKNPDSKKKKFTGKKKGVQQQGAGKKKKK